MNIYIASSKKHMGKIKEDIYIQDALKNNGFSAKITTIKDIIKTAKPFDTVLLKSIWGYHKNHKEFIKQISTLKKNNIRLINDYNFISWNIDKFKYLEEIKSTNIVPTTLLQIKNAKTTLEIENKISKTSKILGANNLVIKPCVSESGYLAFKYDVNKKDKLAISALKHNNHLDFIVQPYRPSISEGEISIIVINGVPLYGIKRFPGIFIEKIDPTYLSLTIIPNAIKKELILLKKFLLKKFGILPNICRVDFIKNKTFYEILEVELIDPDLFFRYIPENIKKKSVSMLCKSFKIMEKSLNIIYRKGVSSLIINKKGQFLLVNLESFEKKYFAIPGGGVEKGETLKNAAYREVYEELGIIKKSLQLVAKSDIPLKFKFKNIKINHDGKNYGGSERYFFGFRFIGKDDEIKLNDGEVRSYKWVSFKQLKDYLLFDEQLIDTQKKIREIFTQF